jgi:hypothetical protein
MNGIKTTKNYEKRLFLFGSKIAKFTIIAHQTLKFLKFN